MIIEYEKSSYDTFLIALTVHQLVMKMVFILLNDYISYILYELRKIEKPRSLNSFKETRKAKTFFMKGFVD